MSQPIETPTVTRPHPGKTALAAEAAQATANQTPRAKPAPIAANTGTEE